MYEKCKGIFSSLLVHYLGVLLGSHRLPGLEAPYEQTRRVVSINDVVDSGASLLRLDRPVQLSRQVIPLTLPSRCTIHTTRVSNFMQIIV
jgi:hypothetical protein